jgi:hypothetical protein
MNSGDLVLVLTRNDQIMKDEDEILVSNISFTETTEVCVVTSEITSTDYSLSVLTLQEKMELLEQRTSKPEEVWEHEKLTISSLPEFPSNGLISVEPLSSEIDQSKRIITTVTTEHSETLSTVYENERTSSLFVTTSPAVELCPDYSKTINNVTVSSLDTAPSIKNLHPLALTSASIVPSFSSLSPVFVSSSSAIVVPSPVVNENELFNMLGASLTKNFVKNTIHNNGVINNAIVVSSCANAAVRLSSEIPGSSVPNYVAPLLEEEVDASLTRSDKVTEVFSSPAKRDLSVDERLARENDNPFFSPALQKTSSRDEAEWQEAEDITTNQLSALLIKMQVKGILLF